MAWAAIDDAILDNPKLGRAGALGLLLHLAAISWCARNLSDGRLPKHKVPCLLNLAGVYVVPGNDPGVPRRGPVAADPVRPDVEAIADHLAAVGLWHDRGESWELHDYLKYNPSRAEVLERRAATRTRVQKHRTVSGCNGVGNALRTPLLTSHPLPLPLEEEKDPDARARATGVEGRARARKPEPEGRPAHHMRRGPARAVPTTPRGGNPLRLGDVLAQAMATASRAPPPAAEVPTGVGAKR
jgi:hypothetical protein